MHSQIIHINKLLLKKFGTPYISKNDPNPLDMIIATILSQNTNDKNSFKAYTELRKKYSRWELAVNEPRMTIEKIIRTAGLAKQKSAAIKNLLMTLSKRDKNISLDYLSELTDEEVLIELTSFKGVGTKTAACVLLFSMKRNICPVDTHVHRTLNRIGIITASTPDKTFAQLHKNFPAKIAHSFHTNLIRLGREICKPANPLCSFCPLEKVCTFSQKNFTITALIKKNDFMLLDNVAVK